MNDELNVRVPVERINEDDYDEVMEIQAKIKSKAPIQAANFGQFLMWFLPTKYHQIIHEEEGKDFYNIQNLIDFFPDYIPPALVHSDVYKEFHSNWITLSLNLASMGMEGQALAMLRCLLDHYYLYQNRTKRFVPLKGLVHYWISDTYSKLGFPVHAKRYMMLALIEDVFHQQGKVPEAGSYHLLHWQYGVSYQLLDEYSEEAIKLRAFYKNQNKDHEIFPEAVLLRIGTDWMTELPSPSEALHYQINKHFLQYLMGRLKVTRAKGYKGRDLERLAHYLLLCMPGCRTTRRKRSLSTDYDLVCSVDGFEVDFRSELGRYFVCECKDKKDGPKQRPMDFGEVAKFCRVLDSVKSRFGVVFSPSGISGEGIVNQSAAARELLKMYHDTGTVIVVIQKKDLVDVMNGQNFITVLHRKYEDRRLDAPKPQKESIEPLREQDI